MSSPAPLTDKFIEPVLDSLLAFYASPMACWRLSGARFAAHKDHTLTSLVRLQSRAKGLNPAYQPARQPGDRFVHQALADALTCPRDLRSCLVRFAPHARWQVTDTYRGHFEDRFFEQEAWCELIGPAGLILSQDVRIGLLIMGPSLDYPAHHHPATD